jgi:signal transduction histidine kinase
MAALGEIAAGAAHEMNNPLTVVSGRSQLLASRLKDPELKIMAQQIVDQSHRLSDMISALRSFAEPADPRRQLVDLPQLLSRVVAEVRAKYEKPERIKTISAGAMPPVLIDARQMAQAIAELIKNALEAKGSTTIEIRVQIEPLDDRLKIMVLDDGSGLSEHALAHAFDPFFSEKPAGRQPGLGLARARRIVEAHGGRLTLENRSGGGAAATIALAEWRGAEMQRRVVA